MLFLCMAFGTKAQIDDEAAYEVEGYSVVHYTDKNGLPQNTIKEIAPDRDGFIWMATEYELIKFDGTNFTPFDMNTLGNGDKDCFRIGTLFTLPGSDNIFVRLGNCQNKTDKIDEITPNGFDEVHFTYKEPPGSRNANITRFTTIEYPLVSWTVFLNNRHEYFYISPKSVERRSLLSGKTISHIPISLKDDRYFLFWNMQYLYLYTGDGVFLQLTHNGLIERLRFPRCRQVVWNKPGKQLFLLDTENNLYEVKQHIDGSLKPQLVLKHLPPHLGIASILHLHKTQTLLVGTYTNGFLLYRKHSAKTHLANLPGFASGLLSVYPHDENCVLAGKNGEIVCKDGTVIMPPKNLFTNGTMGVTRDGMGRYIIFSNEWLTILSQSLHILKRFEFKNAYISTVAKDMENNIWVGENDNIHMLVEGSPKFLFKMPARVLFIKELIRGYLFLGTQNGLYVYSKNSKKYALVPNTEGYNVRSVFRSRMDNFYICAHGHGIFMVLPQSIKKVRPDKTNSLKYAHNMLQDRQGRLWISSNRGLYCVQETDLVKNTLTGSKDMLFYYRFSQKDGLAVNEFNGMTQSSAAQLPGGEMVFPSQNGVVFIHPDSAIFNFPTPIIEVQKIIVDDSLQRLNFNDTLQLSRRFERFEVYLAVPNFGDEENLLVEYTFDKSDGRSWKPAPVNRPFVFTSAEPGYSTLYFRLKNGFGNNNYSFTQLVIHKPKAIWERRLFIPFVVAVILLCSYLYLVVRTRNLRQHNKELAEAVETGRSEVMASFRSLAETTEKLDMKNRFQQWLISSVVHDLRGLLRFIKLHNEIKREDNDMTPEKIKFLKSVYFSTQKIYAYSENLIQLLKLEQNMYFKPEITDFKRLVEEKVEQFQEMAKWNNINFVVDIGDEHEVYVNTTSLSIIVQNLLDNSLKNSPNGNIYISLSYEDGDTVIVIRDEGPGLPPEILRKFNDPSLYETSGPQTSGVGLWLVHSLVRQTGGQIFFKNLPERGLSITLVWN